MSKHRKEGRPLIGRNPYRPSTLGWGRHVDGGREIDGRPLRATNGQRFTIAAREHDEREAMGRG